MVLRLPIGRGTYNSAAFELVGGLRHVNMDWSHEYDDVLNSGPLTVLLFDIESAIGWYGGARLMWYEGLWAAGIELEFGEDHNTISVSNADFDTRWVAFNFVLGLGVFRPSRS